VSCSSAPDGTPILLLGRDWFIELDWAASLPDVEGLDMAVSRVDVEDLLDEASILLSLAQPPTRSPNTAITNAVFNMTIPPH
jgi:hypothetical protein